MLPRLHNRYADEESSGTAGLVARFLLLALLWVVVDTAPLSAQLLQLRDLRREVSFTGVAVSPDGQSVACILQQSDFANNTSPERLVLIPVKGAATRTLATGLYGSKDLRWNARGDRLVFIAKRHPDDLAQVYALSPAGGRLQTLTAAADGVLDYTSLSNGQLVFSTLDPRPARSGQEKYLTAFEVGDNDYLTTERPRPAHLWLLPASGGAATRLTSGSWSIPEQAPILPQHFPSGFFSVAPDGSAIAFSKAPNAYVADDDRAVVQLLDLHSGRAHKLTEHTGLESGGDYSPDGKHIAYWYPRNGFPISSSDIYVTSPAGGNGIDVTRRLDRSPWLAQWMPDSSGLLIAGHDGTHERLWIVRLDGSSRPLPLGELNATESPDDQGLASIGSSGAIAFVASGPQSASELYYVANGGGQPRRLTNFNAYFRSLQLGQVGSLDWTSSEGFHEDGVLTYPPGFVAGKLYPLVLQIHGWPAYASQAAFDTDYPGLSQLLAAHGYLVFEPNYRGSDNLGNRFETAIFNDAGAGPGRDVMAGIAAVEKRGIVDRQRIGISGWSYGGFMTCWLISHYQIWKAAMAGAAPTDANDYALSNYNVLDRHYFGASPWVSKTVQQRYVAQSIMPYAWNIRTPTLILAATGDTTVPITHSYELFHALRDRGVPVSFVAFVSDEHFPSDPVNSEDIYRRWVGWFDRYLRR